MNAINRIWTEAESDLIAQIDARGSDIAGSSAALALKADGLPHRRVEAYRYTDLRRMLKSFPVPATRDASDEASAKLASDVSLCSSTRIVFVNGKFDEELSGSLPAGLSIAKSSVQTASSASAVRNIASVLAPSSWTIVIDASFAGGALEFIAIVDAESAASTHTFISVAVEAGASATLIEQSVTAHGDCLATLAMDIEIGVGAALEHILITPEEAPDQLLTNRKINLAENAKYRQYSTAMGAEITRTETDIIFDGEGAHADFTALTLGGSGQHHDISLLLNHKTPNCTSETTCRSLVRDGAASIFQGKIIVAEGAQKVDAQMLSKGIFLTDDAEIVNKPELEIFADDVACAHGATSGRLDPNALFYLTSRGIAPGEAEQLLAMGVVREILQKLDHDAVRTALEEKVSEWLTGQKEGS